MREEQAKLACLFALSDYHREVGREIGPQAAASLFDDVLAVHGLSQFDGADLLESLRSMGCFGDKCWSSPWQIDKDLLNSQAGALVRLAASVSAEDFRSLIQKAAWATLSEFFKQDLMAGASSCRLT